jgi:hypothetical protein
VRFLTEEEQWDWERQHLSQTEDSGSQAPRGTGGQP